MEKVHYGSGLPRPQEQKDLVIKLLSEGNSMRGTGRLAGVPHQTVGRWLRKFVSSLPGLPTDLDVHSVELDELFTFVKKKGHTEQMGR